MNKKFILPFVFLIFLLATVFAQAANPSVQVIAPVSGSNTVGTVITIDLNISDTDTNSDYLVVDLNYALVTTQGSGTVIINDSNLSSIFTCTTTPFDPYEYDINGYNLDVNDDTSAGVRCTYSWDTTGVPASCSFIPGSSDTQCVYYLNVEVRDIYQAGTIYASGATTFTMTTAGEVVVNLTNFQTMINNSTTLADLVMGGVADQGLLVGLAVGLLIAISLLFVIVFVVVDFLPKIVDSIKRLK